MQPDYSIVLCVGGVNLLSFLLFGLDKLLAVRRKRRIPEATLLTLSVLCGSIGAMLGMIVFHHKTDARVHPAFVWGIPSIFLLELAALAGFFGGR